MFAFIFYKNSAEKILQIIYLVRGCFVEMNEEMLEWK